MAIKSTKNPLLPASLPPEQSVSVLQLALLATVTASAGLAIDLCLPALPFIAKSLAVNPGQVQLSLSVFVLGVGIGQLLYGPVSDQFGRRPVLLSGFLLFTFSSVACIVLAFFSYYRLVLPAE